ncbi:MAG: iron ABC transporter permease [Deltaproteobacteria bacterium]|nr:iron ABC transporter permease [Deltaproteobacteria bacterium]MBI2209833.1 iron ABC transporter permease [Deltaproteobacteria bacterium]MBI2349591.1 iron ABC transporter permease [Deltaproteobacteria bacterium]MBI2991512.1 iron ABC transporter permease [Deltaproteobacteria bacterium]MBI3060596.1 iron ABC transporter permease [Deltaproteobacteria bacterium]
MRRRIALDGGRLALALIILILVYQVVIPLLMVIWTSLKIERPGEAGFFALSFSLANYVRAFSSDDFWRATWTTLRFALTSTLVSFGLGTFLAWLVHRTNTPLARLIGIITLGRIIIPGILITVAWIFMASPSIGILNSILGVRGLFNIYSFWGMVWVHSLEMTPLAYLLLAAALQSMDPRLEEASQVAGAGHWSTLIRISLPLTLPAAGAAVLLLLIYTVETFEVPLLLGGRAHVRVYTTEIYYNTARTPTDWGLSGAYSMAILALCTVLLAVYFRVVRHGERYQTVTGKDFRPRRLDLGRWRYLTCAVGLSLVFLITGIPFLVMLYASFLDRYQPPSLQAFQTMGLGNYREILEDWTYSLYSLWNSTLVGLGTATAVMLLVSTMSYFIYKTRLPGRKLLDFLGFAPIAMPSVVLGTAFLWFYLLVPVPVTGTLIIIGLAYVTRYMAVALRFVSSSMLQIHSELEEAAAVAGGRWWTNFRRVYLPLLRPGLMAGWFWVMVHAYRELTIALMLARSQNRTAAVVIYDLWENGSFPQLSAFGVLIFALLIVLVVIGQAVSKRFGVQEQL